MDEQNQQNNNSEDSGEITLGSGVNIVPQNSSDPEDDVEIEFFNEDLPDGYAPTPQERIKVLREKLRDCIKEKQDYLDGWQRLKADFVNLKKRTEEERADFVKLAREGMITDLLPVLESFHMAFANKEAWEKVDPSWRRGVEHIHTQLTQALAGYGLTALDPVGAPFDPNAHLSIGTTPTDDPAKDHTIAEVLQLGYKLGGKIIKSPKVKVYVVHSGDATSA